MVADGALGGADHSGQRRASAQFLVTDPNFRINALDQLTGPRTVPPAGSGLS